MQAREVRRAGWAMVLIPATMAAARLTLYYLGYGCIIMLVMIAMGTCAQDPNSLPSNKNLPPQVCKGLDIWHDAYRFISFDSDEPEDVLT